MRSMCGYTFGCFALLLVSAANARQNVTVAGDKVSRGRPVGAFSKPEEGKGTAEFFKGLGFPADSQGVPSVASFYGEQAHSQVKLWGAWEEELGNAASEKSASVQNAAPASKSLSARKHAALLQEAKQARSRQDAAATAAAAFDDSKHIVALSDSFRDLEQKDEADEKKFRREDSAARREVNSPSTAGLESPEQLTKRQVQFSKVFTALEQQDDQIQASLTSTDDLGVYGQDNKLQDKSMAMLSTQLADAEKQPQHIPPLMKHDDRSFEAKQLHDPWTALEKEDSESIKNLKRNPNLRLIQKANHIRH